MMTRTKRRNAETQETNDAPLETNTLTATDAQSDTLMEDESSLSLDQHQPVYTQDELIFPKDIESNEDRAEAAKEFAGRFEDWKTSCIAKAPQLHYAKKFKGKSKDKWAKECIETMIQLMNEEGLRYLINTLLDESNLRNEKITTSSLPSIIYLHCYSYTDQQLIGNTMSKLKYFCSTIFEAYGLSDALKSMRGPLKKEIETALTINGFATDRNILQIPLQMQLHLVLTVHNNSNWTQPVGTVLEISEFINSHFTNKAFKKGNQKIDSNFVYERLAEIQEITSKYTKYQLQLFPIMLFLQDMVRINKSEFHSKLAQQLIPELNKFCQATTPDYSGLAQPFVDLDQDTNFSNSNKLVEVGFKFDHPKKFIANHTTAKHKISDASAGDLPAKKLKPDTTPTPALTPVQLTELSNHVFKPRPLNMPKPEDVKNTPELKWCKTCGVLHKPHEHPWHYNSGQKINRFYNRYAYHAMKIEKKNNKT